MASKDIPVDVLSAADRKTIVDALTLYHASLIRAAKAESIAEVADIKRNAADAVLALAGRFR